MEKSLVAANTHFAFKLFAKLVEQEPHKNIFISPASISLALAMVYNGAAGETARAMAEALELGGISLDDLNQANSVLEQTLQFIDPTIQIELANSLWALRGLTFAADFILQSRKLYDVELSDLDCDAAEAAAIINQWVGEKTQARIPEIVKPEDLHDALLVLLNAIYFKGTWTFQFDEANTKERDFTRSDGQRKLHPLMEQEGTFAYFRGAGFQAIELPYGKQETSSDPLFETRPKARVSMYIFLPDVGLSLNDFYHTLISPNWDAWLAQLHPTPGTIILPRFKLEYRIDLKDVLSALGMAVAFTGGADFSRMCMFPVRIEKVIHKAMMEVNEEGTEAAAATAVIMVTLGGEPGSFSMIVDRPFFCVIRDNRSGTILFMGSIVDP